MANEGGNTVPRITKAEHIGPQDTGDNIEAKRVALYYWDGSNWQRASSTTTLAMAPTDASPTYNNLSLGGLPLRTDSAGNLQTYSEITTDQGTGRANWTGSSISYSPGSATFTNGSTTVTGTGFSSTDVHYLDFIKISAHGESAWAQVSYINSDTSITLISAYTGATTTGAYDVSRVGTVTGSGATISVASGQLTLASGSTNSSASVVYKTAAFPPLQNITGTNQLSISQRINNQDIYVGLEQTTSSSRYFARFHFSGTTNTQVITETGYNPTTVPSASETETNTVTLPNGATTASQNTYRVDYQYDQVVFSINGSVVATHIARLPQIWTQNMNNQIRVVNGTGASTTSVVSNFMYIKAYSRIDTSNQVPQAITGQASAGSPSASSAPVSVGGQARTTNPTAVSDGQVVNATFDKLGRQITNLGQVRDLRGKQTTTITSSTTETTIITAAASTFNDLIGLVISNTSSTATRIDFRDTTAGTILFSLEAPATDTRGFIVAGSSIPQTTVNTNWTAQCGTSVADIRVLAIFEKNI